MIFRVDVISFYSHILISHRISLYTIFAFLTPGWLGGWYPFYKHELWYMSTLYMSVPLSISVLILLIGYNPIIFRYHYAVIACLVMSITTICIKIHHCSQGMIDKSCEDFYFIHIFTLSCFITYTMAIMYGLCRSLTVDLRWYNVDQD